MLQSHEYDLPGGGEDMVPERHDLILVTEESGVERWHVRASGSVGEIMKRLQSFWQAKYVLDLSTHRYPTTESQRRSAFELGRLFGEIVGCSQVPDSDICDLLLVAAGISLVGGHITDDQIIGIFGPTNRLDGAEVLSSWKDINLPPLGDIRLASYSQVARRSAEAIFKFVGVNNPELGELHPIPETMEQRENAFKLRSLYEQMMFGIIFHESRNFVLAAAARSMQLGLIYTKGYEKIRTSYSAALDVSRGARFHEEATAQSEVDNEEDEEDLKPWGNISWK